jgi:hypothetical protein
LRARLQPVAPADAQRIARWIADLESERFDVRQQATEELEKLGDLTLPALEKLLAAKPSLEPRQRAERLLEMALFRELSPDQRRQLRALQVLEQVGNSESRKVLELLAQGAPGARLTRESQAILQRLSGQSAVPRSR